MIIFKENLFVIRTWARRLKELLRFSLISALLLTGCARVQPVMTSDNDLVEMCKRFNVDLDLDRVNLSVVMTRGSSKARGLIGSEIVFVNNDKIALSGPLKKSRDSIIIPPDFKNKVIEPLIRQDSRVTVRKFREIVIDPGHGGKDPGTRGRFGSEEKMIVLDIAKRLRGSLEKHGIKTIMTRTKDEFVSLEKRTEIASRSKGDLFVSIHANSSPAKAARGLEVFYLRNLDSHEKKEDQMKENQKALFSQFSMQKNSTVLDNILADMVYTHKQGESEKLANFVTQRTANSINAPNRGSKSSAFFVLRNTLIPAILVEVGFLSNSTEEKALKTRFYRQKIANGLAESILDYANKN